ncbi:MAG: Crp/Fnr family transcriptional regulator [Bacteroidales bacterium]|nr:Crp/Fnr family transcriptional regulator [Bacteroidales bacterium]
MNEEKDKIKCNACVETANGFEKLFSDEIEFLSYQKKQLSYQKGENICKQGAFAPYILYIIKGMARIFLESGSNKNINIAIYPQGSFIGLDSIFGENVYQYSAIALNEVDICMIDKEGLKKLFYKNSEFAMAMLANNCKNEKHLLSLLKTSTHKQMPGKLATALLYLNREEFRKQDILSNLTRKEIADFAGISVESTIKLLKEFQSENLLKLSSKQIEITDKKRLTEISLRG